jgi:hypothetical protein
MGMLNLWLSKWYEDSCILDCDVAFRLLLAGYWACSVALRTDALYSFQTSANLHRPATMRHSLEDFSISLVISHRESRQYVIWTELGYLGRYRYGLRAGRPRFDSLQGSTQPPVQWVLEALSSGVELPEREADHTLPSSVEVKIGGAIPSHMSSWRGS